MLSPSPQWPQAALRLGGDGRQLTVTVAASSLGRPKGRTVFGKESFESIPETSRSSVETCTWAI